MEPAASAEASPYDAVIGRLERFVAHPAWIARSVALLVFTALTLGTPFWEEKRFLTSPNWTAFRAKRDALLTPVVARPEEHGAKTAFRFTVPVVARVLGLETFGVLAVQAALGLAFLALALRIGERDVGDRVTAFLLTAALAFTYVGAAAFVDLATCFDAWGYVFLLAAMWVKHPLLVFACSSLAAWTDERALVALLLVATYRRMPEPPSDEASSRAAGVPVLAAVLLYAFGRWFLGARYGLSTPTHGVGVDVLRWHLVWVGLGIWTFLEGLWIPILAALWTWRDTSTRPYIAASLLGVALLTGGALSVIDLTRSGGYSFPAAFIALRLLAPRTTPSFVRATFFTAALVCLLFPDHNLMTGWQMPWVIRAPFGWTPYSG